MLDVPHWFRLLFVWLCSLFVGRGVTPATTGLPMTRPSGLQPAVDPAVVQGQPTEVDKADAVEAAEALKVQAAVAAAQEASDARVLSQLRGELDAEREITQQQRTDFAASNATAYQQRMALVAEIATAERALRRRTEQHAHAARVLLGEMPGDEAIAARMAAGDVSLTLLVLFVCLTMVRASYQGCSLGQHSLRLV